MKKQSIIMTLGCLVIFSLLSGFSISLKKHKKELPVVSPQESFTYTAPKPVNGVLKGVVELGATGFNMFIVNIDKQKNWELKKAEFGNSLVMEHMATESDIRTGLKSYIGDMLAYGVPGNNIHFVVSSGADRDPKVLKVISVLKNMHYFVNTVTAEQEAEYGLRATMPKDFYENSFFIDMGSSNTKVSYLENGKRVGLETFGSKYFENKTSDDEVYKGVMAVVQKVPASKRSRCFIIGGIPFQLATPVRKEKERYTVLNGPGEYDKLAADKGQKVKAGLNIYKAIQDATGCKQFVFDWDSDFTIGFLLTLK